MKEERLAGSDSTSGFSSCLEAGADGGEKKEWGFTYAQR
jgi:hypothetical protein